MTLAPRYVRRCLQDGIARLQREEISHTEFEQLKKELKRKRQVPLWFKERFVLDYDDQIELKSDLDLSECWEQQEQQQEEKEDSPKKRQLKRTLQERYKEGKESLDVKMKKLSPGMVAMYKGEMDAYNEMLLEEREGIEKAKAIIQRREDAGGPGKGSAKGVGFAGVNEEELMEQKAKVTCKAKKQHRFNACKKCSGCRTQNCGECEYCLDMPRFGGQNLKKQKCELRICVNPQLRTCDMCVWNV